MVRIGAQSYFITTNADYIPSLPIRENHSVYLREDYRYGDDDPTLWPQQYSVRFCHLGAIHKKVSDKLAMLVMWWNPSTNDFICPESGLSITRGLGRLSQPRVTQLAKAIDVLLSEYCEYEKGFAAPDRPIDLFPALIQQVRLGLERLQCLPSTYNKMALGITQLQRNFLELHGLLRYMMVYKRRMDNPESAPARHENCIGIFTSDPVVVQQFQAAGLPYWFLRPTWTFKNENILAIATPVDPADLLTLAPHAEFPAIQTGLGTYVKVEAIRSTWRNSPWYHDPFGSSELQEQPLVTGGGQATMHSSAPIAGPSRGVGQSSRPVNQEANRYRPCEWCPQPSRSSLTITQMAPVGVVLSLRAVVNRAGQTPRLATSLSG